MTKTTYLKSLLLIIAIGFSSFGVYASETTFFSFLGSSGYLAPPASGWTTDGTVEGGTYLKLAVGSIISPEYQPAHSLTFKYDIASFGSGSGTATKLYILNASDNSVITEFPLLSASSSTYTTNQTVTIPTISSVFKIKIEGEGNGSTIRATRLRNFSLVGTSASSCTASTLSFADASINKTMGDAAFTITATSLNATTAITYESDNTAAATVNETTGEVTIVGVGTAKIKATQAAGTHASVDYCAATAEYTLNVATNLPTITVTEVLPAFIANVGANDQKTLTVTGANLTADIALTITGDNAAMFSVTNTLPAVGGTATITYSPTAPGAHTATLALNSAGATEVLISLNGTGLTLSGNGTKTTPYTVADVKSLNNSLASATKYWVEGYIVGTPSGGNGVDLTTVALEAPFSSNSALVLADMSGETDLTKMIAVQLPSGAVRDALNLADNSGNLNRRVKVFGTLEGYFSGTPGVKSTTEYEFDITSVVPSATMQSLRKVGNQIVFETSAQQSVEIFNVTGQRLMSTTSVDGVNAITVNTKGLVLVKIGKETAKVIM